MKKLLISIFILFGLLFGNINFVNSEARCSGNGFFDGDNLCSSNYTIDTNLLLGTSDNVKGATAKDTVDNLLTTTVEKLMIALGVLALFIMTIGGGYMIFAAGQDEMLNKGKSIFNAGLIALLVALASTIIIKIVIYLLYPAT